MTAININPKFFVYTVEYFNDIMDEVHNIKGIVAACSYGQAAETIEKIYDPNNLISMELYESFILLDEYDLHEEFKV